MRAKLIRKIPAREGLPYWFDRYEFECIECGTHYFSGRCDNRTRPYCCDCSRKHEREREYERKAKKEQQMVNDVLNDIRAEIERGHKASRYRYWSYKDLIEMIDKRMKQ